MSSEDTISGLVDQWPPLPSAPAEGAEPIEFARRWGVTGRQYSQEGRGRMDSRRVEIDGEERNRLRALARYGILDTPPDEAFERITRLAARIAGTRVAYIAFLDRDRQWIKSRFGWETAETPRGDVMCSRDILEGASVMVPDTTRDARLHRHALVTGAPHFRFFAAAPLRTPDGYTLGALCVADRTPRSEPDPALAAMLVDLAAVVMSELELRSQILQRVAAQRELWLIADSVPAQISFFDRDFRYRFVNQRYSAWFGRRREDIIGRRLDEIVGPAAFRTARPHIQRALDGEAVTYENRIPRKDGAIRDVLVSCRPRRTEGRIEGVYAVAVDITEQKQGEGKLRLLNAQLDHRLKNTLATVQVLLEQAAMRDGTKAELAEDLAERLGALAEAHNILNEAQTEDIELRRIFETQLEPYRQDRADRFVCVGEKVLLPPEAAVPLAVAVHELIVNSSRFGALSQPGGSVRVAWRIDREPDAKLRLEWRESGGPRVEAPHKTGYGMEAIERLLSYDLHARSRLSFAPEGLQWALEAPLPKARAANGGQGRPGGKAARTPAAPYAKSLAASGELDGVRVLIAEDSAHIAFSLEAVLRAAGAVVVGPVATLAGARQLAASEPFELAIVDINLDNEMSFPLIDELLRVGVRVIISTGYDLQRQFPGRVPDLPVLRKPYTTQQLLSILQAREAVPAHARGTH